MMRFSVLLPLAIENSYDYLQPISGEEVALGQFVRVPLKNKIMTGIVWARAQGELKKLDKRKKPIQLRAIQSVFDIPPLKANQREFIDWVADYIMAPKGSVLHMAMPPKSVFTPPKPMMLVKKAGRLPEDFKSNPKRDKILALALTPISRPALAKKASVSASLVQTLLKARALIEVESDKPQTINNNDAQALITHPQPLSKAQKKAVDEIGQALDKARFQTFLLDGVTGSGKTEIYFDAIAKSLKQGKQALLLLPEIALTSYMAERFKQYCNGKMALWHSHMSPAQRRKIWLDIAQGQSMLVIGARSALFLPFFDLGVIVVDEEHDEGFKQDDGVSYHARDMAIKRAFLEHCPIVLSSATPSLESWDNIKRKGYRHLVLPERARRGAKPPSIHLIDLRAQKLKANQWLAQEVIEEVEKTIKRGEQALLFLNRRGYAPLILCRHCGFRFSCPHCDSWLVEHRHLSRLLCHHCDFHQPLPSSCPQCHQSGKISACGPGIERVFEECRHLFPQARIECLSRDLPSDLRSRQKILDDMAHHQLDILIGTQIIAKGLHFPKLTFVGIIDADLGFANADLRANERSFQLLQQVSGRAGRDILPGKVFVQTFMPHHLVMRTLAQNDRQTFLKQESAARHYGGWPPYGRMAMVLLSSQDKKQLSDYARHLKSCAPKIDNQGFVNQGAFRLFGPAPAPIFRKNKFYRLRFLLKTDRKHSPQAFLRSWFASAKPPPFAVRRNINIDPHSFI